MLVHRGSHIQAAGIKWINVDTINQNPFGHDLLRRGNIGPVCPTVSGNVNEAIV